MREASAEGIPVPSATLDAISGLIYRLDFDGRLRWWNDRFADATGYDDADLDGLHVRELLVEADHDRARAACRAVRDSGEWHGILRLQASSGETLTHRHDIAAVPDHPEVVTGVARDSGRDTDANRDDTYRRVAEAVGNTVDALASANTSADIERALCERLADSGLYSGVWVGHLDSDGRIEVTTAVGATVESVERLSALWADLDQERPAAVAAESGDAHVVRNIQASDLPAPVRELAADYGVVSGAAVPIESGSSSRSVLSVYTDQIDAFGDIEIIALDQLCRVAGIAADAMRTERLIISEPSVELEFRQTDPAVPLVSLALDEDIEGRLKQVRRNSAGDIVERFEIDGADPETIVRRWTAADNVRSCRLVDEQTSLYDISFDRSAAGTLLDAGAEMQDVWTVGNGVHFTATVPTETDVRSVVERIRAIYPETKLVAKRTLSDSGDGGVTPAWTDDVGVTDRQLDVLAAAAEAGYFEWPRDATAEEVADRLDISAATLHYHLRRAERGLIDAFLDAQR